MMRCIGNQSWRRLIALALIFGLPVAGQGSFASAQARAPALSSQSGIGAYVAEASRRFAIPERWIWAVMRAESAGKITATSHAGAMGLMQIMPRTWAQLRVRYRLGSDPYHPRDNIFAGTAYLRELHDRYGNPVGMLAAYNAGPGRYDEHLKNGRPLPQETRSYPAKLSRSVGGIPADGPVYASAATVSWTHAPLFLRQDNVPPVPRQSDTAVMGQATDDPRTSPVSEPETSLFVAVSPRAPR
jgi:hypothetical protein